MLGLGVKPLLLDGIIHPVKCLDDPFTFSLNHIVFLYVNVVSSLSKSADPDGMPHIGQSHLDLHYLPFFVLKRRSLRQFMLIIIIYHDYYVNVNGRCDK